MVQANGATTQKQERAKYELIEDTQKVRRKVRLPQPGTRLQHARQSRGCPHVDSKCLVEAHWEWHDLFITGLISCIHQLEAQSTYCKYERGLMQIAQISLCRLIAFFYF